jgi:hypothetical protein
MGTWAAVRKNFSDETDREPRQGGLCPFEAITPALNLYAGSGYFAALFAQEITASERRG